MRICSSTLTKGNAHSFNTENGIVFAYDASANSIAQPVEPSITHQWTDEAGHTWRRMSDGASFWWSGKDWQIVEPRSFSFLNG
jgi:hypothetical protein